MGVGKITVVDFDRVEVDNLPKSVLYTPHDAAMRRPKVEAAAEGIRRLNKHTEVVCINGDIAYDVGLGTFRTVDVVIGCVDNRWARYSINRLCMRAGIPWVDGGIDGLEGTARVFIPGINCYACNLGPEGMKDMARRMSCTGAVRQQMMEGKVPTTSVVASVIGAVEAQEAIKLLHREEIENGSLTSLCGRMFYYDGEHLTTKIADFKAYDEDCAVHEEWSPVMMAPLTTDSTVAETIDVVSNITHDDKVSITLNDCFVDYVIRRSDNRKTEVMCASRYVADMVGKDEQLSSTPLSGLYQNEYRTIDDSFPYMNLRLGDLGVPSLEVLHATSSSSDCYIGLER